MRVWFSEDEGFKFWFRVWLRFRFGFWCRVWSGVGFRVWFRV